MISSSSSSSDNRPNSIPVDEGVSEKVGMVTLEVTKRLVSSIRKLDLLTYCKAFSVVCLNLSLRWGLHKNAMTSIDKATMKETIQNVPLVSLDLDDEDELDFIVSHTTPVFQLNTG